MSILTAIAELLEARRHNRELYASGRANRRVIVKTTVGWRPDPWYQQDGMCERDACETPSHEPEYSRVVREPKRKR